VKRVLLESAAGMLQAAVEDLEAADGSVWVKGSPERRASFSDVARRSVMVSGSPPVGSGCFDPSDVPKRAETGSRSGYPAYVFATQVAEVEVDLATGEVEVLRITAAHDCGTAINPMMVEGQIEGGISMGLGYALLEEMVLKDGAVQNAEFANYHLPTAYDMPEVQIAIVDRPECTGPFGAKGIAEPSLIPTAPAIVNAIYDAVGVRMRELPVTPSNLLSAIRADQRAGPD
jgi:CO/xanthine dehydrogenase Mo-binding subunit